LMFWQAINTRKVSKKITAKFELAYEWKDKEKKDFLDSKDFKVTYEEKYVWVNYYVVGGWVGLILLVLVYFIIIAPKQRRKREEELKRKIMEEMNK
jgi:ascorbate-specific PTS system EIIC-type component UlaA